MNDLVRPCVSFLFAAVIGFIEGTDILGIRFLDLSERKVESCLALLRDGRNALLKSP